MKKLQLLVALLALISSSAKAQPAGTIIAYGGEITTIPSGYLICDGKEYSANQYKELAKAIGTAWGSSVSGKFNVPDLRGLFLRGVNGNRVDAFKDPDVNNRTSVNNGNPGNAVGSVQAHELASHNHNLSGAGNANDQYSPSLTGGNYNVGRTWEIHGGGQVQGITDAKGGSETRPNNAYVNWLIKAK